MKPLVDKSYILQKFPGKGGWTYALIPEVLKDRNSPFGWVTVRGSIDDHVLEHHKLMPYGDGNLFLPVKASVRKKIGKEAGDSVRIILYPERNPYVIQKEILECFDHEPPSSLETFLGFTDSERKSYIDWINGAKSDETKANRIMKMMDKLKEQLKLHE